MYADAQDSYRSQVVETLNASMVVAVPEMGCTPLENAEQMAGNIAVINRGACFFAEKARNAETAGAVGVIITNNRIESLVKMTGDFSAVTIPAMMVTQDGGAELRKNSGRACAIRIGMRSIAWHINEQCHAATVPVTVTKSMCVCMPLQASGPHVSASS